MRFIDADSITQIVLASLGATQDKRLREILTSLVQHLHAFARETLLTEAELRNASWFLTAAGKITRPEREEFKLLSDVLGLSALVTAQNAHKLEIFTEAAVAYASEGKPRQRSGCDSGTDECKSPCFVSGHVLSADGIPISGAAIGVCLGGEYSGFEKMSSDAQGHYHFRTRLPEAYSIEHDGPVGDLLTAIGRQPLRPAHLHFEIDATGHERLVTDVFRNDDPHLDSDVVFGVRSSLIGNWKKHGAGAAPDGTHMTTPFYTLVFDFILNPKVTQ